MSTRLAPPPARAGSYRLSDAVRSEWTKFLSLRSTR